MGEWVPVGLWILQNIEKTVCMEGESTKKTQHSLAELTPAMMALCYWSQLRACPSRHWYLWMRQWCGPDLLLWWAEVKSTVVVSSFLTVGSVELNFWIDTGAAWNPHALSGRRTSICKRERESQELVCLGASEPGIVRIGQQDFQVFIVFIMFGLQKLMTTQRHEGLRTRKPVGYSTHKSTEAYCCQAQIV